MNLRVCLVKAAMRLPAKFNQNHFVEEEKMFKLTSIQSLIKSFAFVFVALVAISAQSYAQSIVYRVSIQAAGEPIRSGYLTVRSTLNPNAAGGRNAVDFFLMTDGFTSGLLQAGSINFATNQAFYGSTGSTLLNNGLNLARVTAASSGGRTIITASANSSLFSFSSAYSGLNANHFVKSGSGSPLSISYYLGGALYLVSGGQIRLTISSDSKTLTGDVSVLGSSSQYLFSGGTQYTARITGTRVR